MFAITHICKRTNLNNEFQFAQKSLNTFKGLIREEKKILKGVIGFIELISGSTQTEKVKFFFTSFHYTTLSGGQMLCGSVRTVTNNKKNTVKNKKKN